MVEHDEDTMFAADQVSISDREPENTVANWLQQKSTGDHESKTVDHRCIFERKDQDSGSGDPKQFRPAGLKVLGAAENNLKNIDVKFPLGVMTCVTAYPVRVKFVGESNPLQEYGKRPKPCKNHSWKA